MKITIKEISTKNELKKFIKFPNKLYSHNKFYIPALHSKEMQTFTQENNPAFEFCEVKFWLAYRNNEIVGRVAGIINHNYNKKINKKYVRFGWIDFIENVNVLQHLCNAVETWAKQNNAEYIHGPLGFSSFDSSGILIEGFNELPTSFAHYNYPYYSKLIEKLGYKKDIDWVEYNVKVPKSVPENYIKIAGLIKKKHTLHSAELKNKKNILKYSDEIFQLLNVEYKQLYAFSELTKKQIEELKKQFIPILRLEYLSIILDSEDKVVGFGICMPSLSKALQKSNGRLFPFGFLRIMYALRKNHTVDSLLIAIQKKYRGKGVNAIIFNDLGRAFLKNGITNIESTRELESNFNISNLWNKFEYRQHKRTRCYIKKL
ncbi:MAG: N-acetyltransferase [Bacteroidales bacterium]|nr:N-acetyltransferase [Bacteroidales bacterium]